MRTFVSGYWRNLPLHEHFLRPELVRSPTPWITSPLSPHAPSVIEIYPLERHVFCPDNLCILVKNPESDAHC